MAPRTWKTERFHGGEGGGGTDRRRRVTGGAKDGSYLDGGSPHREGTDRGANEWRWRRRASDARGNEPVGIAAHLLRGRHRAGNAGLTRPRSGVADCEDVGMARYRQID